MELWAPSPCAFLSSDRDGSGGRLLRGPPSLPFVVVLPLVDPAPHDEGARVCSMVGMTGGSAIGTEKRCRAWDETETAYEHGAAANTGEMQMLPCSTTSAIVASPLRSPPSCSCSRHDLPVDAGEGEPTKELAAKNRGR